MGATAAVFPRFNGNKVGVYNEDALQAILDLQDKHLQEFKK